MQWKKDRNEKHKYENLRETKNIEISSTIAVKNTM
jgi:hypothetical protein